jgi:hypothetical protein
MIRVDAGAAGQQIACSACEGTIQVPSAEVLAAAAPPQPPPPPLPSEPANPPQARSGLWPPVPLELMSLSCPACANAFHVPPSAAGLELPCPSCQHLVTIPAPSTDAVAAPVPDVETGPETASEPHVEKLLPPQLPQTAMTAPATGGIPFSAPQGEVAALLDRPKLVGEGASEFEVRRLSPQEKARRRAVRNVILFVLGLAGLVAIGIAMMRR